MKIPVILLMGATFFSAPLFGQAWQWQNPLPTGNPVNAVDFVDSLNGWFASTAGTILHTSDGGNSWEIQNTGIDVWFLAVDFVDVQSGWAAGQFLIPAPTGGTYGGGAIVHTSNGGKDWTVQLIDTLTSFDVITFIDRQYGWAGGQGQQIFYTKDGGITWKGVEFPILGGPRVLSIAFVDSLRGWAEGGLVPLLVTEDGGRSWQADTTVTSGTLVFFADSVHGWVIGPLGQVWRTVDGGNTWRGGMDVIPGQGPSAVFFINSLVGWVSIGDLDGGLFQTLDGGETWQKLSTGVPGGLFFFDHLSGWVGFSRTFDGGRTLDNQRQGFTTPLFDVEFLDEHTGWVVGFNGFIAKTLDGGKNWQVQQSGMPFNLFGLDVVDEMNAWAVGSREAIVKTEDGGLTWQVQRFEPDSLNRYNDVTFVDPQTGWIVGNTILSTKDGGLTWIEQGSLQMFDLRDITFTDVNQGWIVGAAPFGGGVIYHTNDGGQAWNLQYENPDHSLRAVFFLNENIGWAAGSTIIVSTKDGGAAWGEQSGGKAAFSNDIIFTDENNGLTCGVSGEILVTHDGGATWHEQFRTTTNPLNAFAFVDSQIGWLVGWDGTILHTVTGGVTSVQSPGSPDTNPNDFLLYANYPNPFNAQTVIRYEMTKSGRVILTIYDLLGREIVRLIDNIQAAGVHQVVWDGKTKLGAHAPTGLYFYRLLFAGSQKTGKMLLLR